MTTEQQTQRSRFAQLLLNEGTDAPGRRLKRLYQHPGGPLVGWLLDDAGIRGHSKSALAERLGIDVDALTRLEGGLEPELLHDLGFLGRAAAYLGVPRITARLLIGDITIRDFATQAESEVQRIEREFARFLAVPDLRALVVDDPATLPLDYKRFMLDVHATHRGLDWPELPRLPEMLRWLQRAAVMHNANEIVAAAGESGEAGGGGGVDGRSCGGVVT
jgi:transcriptional regulator with XRE-family HTH domain